MVRILKTIMVALSLTTCSGAYAVCKTEISVFYDASKSIVDVETNSATKLLELLNEMQGVSELNVDLIPFGTWVGEPCRWTPQSTSSPLIETISCQNRNQYSSAQQNTKITDRSDIVKMWKAVYGRLSKPLEPKTRQVIIIFSDFRHDITQSVNENAINWRKDNVSKLIRVRDLLYGNGARDLILFEQRFSPSPSDMSVPTMSSIVEYLRDVASVNMAVGDESFRSIVQSRALSDPRPLRISLVGMERDKLIVKLDNLSCNTKIGLSYWIHPFEQTDARLGWIELAGTEMGRDRGIALKNCPREISPLEPIDKCTLPRPHPDTPDKCLKYVLTALSEEPQQSFHSTPFTLTDCFILHQIDLDIAKNANGATHFQDCLSVRGDDIKLESSQKDSKSNWDLWRDADLKENKENVDADKQDSNLRNKKTDIDAEESVEFIACVRAEGAVFDELATFTGKMQFPGEKNLSIVLKSPPIDMGRFSDGYLPDVRRAFPVFFSVEREMARKICVQPHQEIPDGLKMWLTFSKEDKPVEPLTTNPPEIVLMRNRDRDLEEDLHDAWESIIVPLLFVIAISILIVWFSRHRALHSVEETIGLVGLGAAALGAALHDATNLGDKFEQTFANNPVLWTELGVYLLAGFMLMCIWIGVFEGHRNATASMYTMVNTSLLWRTSWLLVRLTVATALVGSLTLWARGEIRHNTKAIEECHFAGQLAVHHNHE